MVCTVTKDQVSPGSHVARCRAKNRRAHGRPLLPLVWMRRSDPGIPSNKAEGGRFELPRGLLPYSRSRRAHSTTLASLRFTAGRTRSTITCLFSLWYRVNNPGIPAPSVRILYGFVKSVVFDALTTTHLNVMPGEPIRPRRHGSALVLDERTTHVYRHHRS